MRSTTTTTTTTHHQEGSFRTPCTHAHSYPSTPSRSHSYESSSGSAPALSPSSLQQQRRRPARTPSENSTNSGYYSATKSIDNTINNIVNSKSPSATARMKLYHQHRTKLHSSFSKDGKVEKFDSHRLFRRGYCLGLCTAMALAGYFLSCSWTLQSTAPLLSLLSLQGPFTYYYTVTSDFTAKPTVVGFVSPRTVDPETVNNLLEEPPATKQRLKSVSSNYQVVRIHPLTFRVVSSSSNRNSNNKHVRYQNSATNETIATDFGWDTSSSKNRRIDLMGNGWLNPLPNDIALYRPGLDDNNKIVKKECDFPQPWQTQSFPTCNTLHEQDSMAQLIHPERLAPKFLMGSGSMRDVWLLEHCTNYDSPIETTVLKTLRLHHEFDDDNLDRHRRDAVISERLTKSPHFLDIYGYCGQSAVYQYARGGSLYDAIGAKEFRDEARNRNAYANYLTWTSRRKFDIAFQVVSAVADLHDIDHDGKPSVAHDDLDITQFVSTDNGKTYKLSDFNGAEILKWSEKKQNACMFLGNMKGGKTRSPEEYRKDWLTQKIDIYAMSNILYTILVGRYPFDDLGSTEASDLVVLGGRPQIGQEYEESDDPLVKTMVKAILMGWKQDPDERASAKEIKRMMLPHALVTEKDSTSSQSHHRKLMSGRQSAQEVRI